MRLLRIKLCVAMLLALLVPASVVRAQFTERTIPPSTPAQRHSEQAAPGRAASDIPALAIPRAAPSRSTTQTQATTASPAPSPGATNAEAPSAQRTAAATKPIKYFPYTVSAGDTLGKIAQTLGVDAGALAHLNRLRPDDELFIGEKLRIPNPFEAERRNLESELARLKNDDSQTHDKLGHAEADILSLKERNDSLTAANASLERDAAILPWWRGTALGVCAAALLMLGVTVLTLFEWWILRRKFVALSDLAATLGQLDVKYKETLAKAELRMQQLYGRRRAGMPEASEHPVKTQEEIEIERLNRQLKAVLEDYLDRLGIRPRGAKPGAGWREMVGESEESELDARGGVGRS